MNAHDGPPTVTVGQAARAAGITPKAARFYEARGLLPPAERSDAGYRLYTDIDRTITELRQLRRTLTHTRATATRASAGDVCRIIEHALGSV